ncbi:MAG TPA: FtsX-like permease family protein [Geminicoccaceae bacterium]|nr:FtsX-like permease family protein [Geminicoccaceae bacterium]
MTARRFDLPLAEAALTRFMPWTIAALVYLAVLALAVAAVADGALRLYGPRARLATVTLPAVPDAGQSAQEIAAALGVLQKTRGVTSVTLVPTEELEQLVEPWLGGVETDGHLPLPRLIDVTLDPQAETDLAALRDRLQEVAAGATLGVEAGSDDRAERMAAFVRAWGGGAGVLALLGSVLAVALITRVSLRAQARIVELLRSMGAPDSYLAGQFERYALWSGLRGGLAGFALAALTILALLSSGRAMEFAGPVALQLRPLDWLLLACVPAVSVLLVTAIARMTAARGLAQLS